MKIKVASQAGYCYGVERALKMTDEAVRSQKKPIFTLGPIIHNPQVVESFKARGVEPITDPDDAGEGTIIVRTHGVDPLIIEKAKRKGLSVVDATCPFVANAQQRVEQLVHDGYDVVIIGEKEHPEVKGILAHAGGRAGVVEKISDINKIKRGKPIGVVVQTTQPLEHFQKILSGLVAKTAEIKVFNTICGATSRRQSSAKKIAEQADVMIVVGGKNSANTSRLVQICRATGTRTFHIEIAEELKRSWFDGIEVVGLTAGASTPEWRLNEVLESLKEIK